MRKAKRLAATRKFAPSWIRDAHDVRCVLAGGYFDAAAADHVIAFFEFYLRHSKGRWAGKAFTLQPWQQDITRRLFGWKLPDGTRRYRKAYIEIPKKNGKSTWLAGLELYALVADGEAGAEVALLAVDKDQAGNVFRECATMVRQSPELNTELGRHISDSKKEMEWKANAGRLFALSADAAKQEGLNLSFIGADELHAWKNRVMWDAIVYAGAARLQPMLVMITTAGIYDPGSIGYIQHEYARQVIDGTIEDFGHLSVIYGTTEKQDWTDPKVWALANPSWGVTIAPEAFTQEAKAAQSDPTAQNAFRRYRLNQWVRQVTRAIDLTVWDASAGHPTPFEREELRGRSCDLGLDLSSVNDLTAAIYTFHGCADDDDAVDVFCRFWIPSAQLDDQKNPNRALYQQWVDAGYLTDVPGKTIKYDVILAAILEDASVFVIRDVNIDALFQGQHLANQLEEEGLSVFAMRQGFISFGPAWKETKRLFLEGKLHHGNNPVLRFCADNVVIAMDPAGNEKVIKEQGPKKVDGIVALNMAIDRYRRHGADDSGGSIYEQGESLGL